MAKLSIVGFASGSPLSQMAMARIARDQRLLAVVTPAQPSNFRDRLRRLLGRPGNPLGRLGAPLIGVDDVARYQPDLLVVASFPRVLSAGTLAAARIGALNVHMSALPRQRGTDPVFWTYWDDEPESAVTIHWIDQRIDAGDIAAQRSLAFARGLPSRELYMQLAALGVDLLAELLAKIAAGEMPRIPQDDSRASYRSAAATARARVPFAQWPAERVWHVLSGLGDQWSNLLVTAAGEALPHRRARRFRLSGDVEPGRVDVLDTTYELHCSDGIVTVERHAP